MVADIIGAVPDYKMHVRRDVPEESDRPVLRYGLQQMHGGMLTLPNERGQWPDHEALKYRFEQFKKAA